MALSRQSGHAPFQLPDCLQFVYADYSEADLHRLPQFNVDPSLRAAYARTSRATHNLLPNFDASPEVTKMLRPFCATRSPTGCRRASTNRRSPRCTPVPASCPPSAAPPCSPP
ncbi:hypothetical protein WKI71_31030 [Streptomyces sp. MS1.AVA.1]|uniref:Uncharacterized protein n=1 Tax=Streptomyces machairae TaxID=3134109 RepID=A0ABU8UQN7_9ACTN